MARKASPSVLGVDTCDAAAHVALQQDAELNCTVGGDPITSRTAASTQRIAGGSGGHVTAMVVRGSTDRPAECISGAEFLSLH